MPTIHKIPVSAVRNELRRRKAVRYLREQGIYRGDIRCRHRYEPHNPDDLRDLGVKVTVCRTVAHVTVNHAMRA